MGSDQIFKKSVLGGFKKEAVLNYIEQLQFEIIELKREISNKPDLSNEVESLKAINENAASEAAALTAKNDALKAENEALSDKNDELIQELENARKTICEYEEKQKIFEEKIGIIEEKFALLSRGYKSKESSGIDSEAVNNAKKEISAVNDEITAACIDFAKISSVLKSSAQSLIEILSVISEDEDE